MDEEPGDEADGEGDEDGGDHRKSWVSFVCSMMTNGPRLFGVMGSSKLKMPTFPPICELDGMLSPKIAGMTFCQSAMNRQVTLNEVMVSRRGVSERP